MANFLEACKDVLENNARYKDEIRNIEIRKIRDVIKFFATDTNELSMQFIVLSDIEADWIKIEDLHKSLFEKRAVMSGGLGCYNSDIQQAVKEISDFADMHLLPNTLKGFKEQLKKSFGEELCK